MFLKKSTQLDMETSKRIWSESADGTRYDDGRVRGLLRENDCAVDSKRAR